MIWVHVKTGGRYILIGEGVIEKTNTPCVMYTSILGGPIWVRPTDEFHDGRFVMEVNNNEIIT